MPFNPFWKPQASRPPPQKPSPSPLSPIFPSLQLPPPCPRAVSQPPFPLSQPARPVPSLFPPPPSLSTSFWQSNLIPLFTRLDMVSVARLGPYLQYRSYPCFPTRRAYPRTLPCPCTGPRTAPACMLPRAPRLPPRAVPPVRCPARALPAYRACPHAQSCPCVALHTVPARTRLPVQYSAPRCACPRALPYLHALPCCACPHTITRAPPARACCRAAPSSALSRAPCLPAHAALSPLPLHDVRACTRYPAAPARTLPHAQRLLARAAAPRLPMRCLVRSAGLCAAPPARGRCCPAATTLRASCPRALPCRACPSATPRTAPARASRLVATDQCAAPARAQLPRARAAPPCARTRTALP
ncbi:unnamed protein product [Closterium sp. NIES-65]|nr:unnamed protein product [Closterium sp. NIES-65]